MAMEEKAVKILEEKITDYKRFAFILLALTGFLFVGLIVPTEGISSMQQLFLIAGSVCTILFAVLFHRKAMKCQEQLYKED